LNREEQQRRFIEWAHAFDNLLWKAARSFATGADQDDLHQELLLALWKSIPAFRGDAKASTYVYRVAYNYALTWTRRAKRHEVGLEQAAGVAAGGAPDATESQLDRLYEQLRELKPLDRTLILLYLDDIGYREMADITGLSEGNVGVRLNRVKKLLAQRLQEV
jgi:RNA polymerase sigma-70 factor (ECF subfamily)